MVPAQLSLAPNTPDDVTEVRVAVRYQNAAAGVDDGTTVDCAPTTAPGWSVAPGEGRRPGELHPDGLLPDGASETLAPWCCRTPRRRTPWPSASPGAGRLDGDIILVDALGEVAKAVVDLEVSQQGAVVDNRSVEIAGLQAGSPGRCASPSATSLPRCAGASGSRRRRRSQQLDWAPAASTALVAGVPSEGVLAVQVRYVGPLPSAAGLAGVVVDLAYADPGGDAAYAQNTSLFFDDAGAGTPQEWRASSGRPGGPLPIVGHHHPEGGRHPGVDHAGPGNPGASSSSGPGARRTRRPGDPRADTTDAGNRHHQRRRLLPLLRRRRHHRHQPPTPTPTPPTPPWPAGPTPTPGP